MGPSDHMIDDDELDVQSALMEKKLHEFALEATGNRCASEYTTLKDGRYAAIFAVPKFALLDEAVWFSLTLSCSQRCLLLSCSLNALGSTTAESYSKTLIRMQDNVTRHIRVESVAKGATKEVCFSL